MPNQKLLRKLQIKPDYQLLLLNSPAEFAQSLKPYLISAQFAGSRSALLPLYDSLIAAATNYGADVTIAPHKSYIVLHRKKTFALIKTSTRDRLDLGLKLPCHEAMERLPDACGFGSGSITHRLSLHEAGDINGEVLTWLRAGYNAAG
jgi:hypothetical protein